MALDFLLFQKLIIALLLGSLIGLEREHSIRKEHEEFEFAGIRTFAIFSLIGAVSQIFFSGQDIFFWLLSAFVFLLIIAGYVVSSLKTGRVGATTELAAIGVYIIGIIAGRGEFFIATALTLLVLIILYFKSPLHKLAHIISKKEFTSTVKFMLIAFIVLPLLPNKTFGPFDVFNPYLIWLMVVFISGISFASYLAVKFLGRKRGIGLTGFFAGFVSSTALTLSFSGESKKYPQLTNPFVFSLILASSAMFFRILVVIAVLNQNLLENLIIPMGVMGLTGTILAVLYWRKKEASDAETETKLKLHTEKIESPFTLKPALKFGLIFALILFISKTASLFFGNQGIYAASLLSGILDADPITVSLANLAKTDVSEAVAGKAIFLAAITNTFSKGVLFTILGSRRVARQLWIAFGIIILTGIFSFLAIS